MKRRAQYIKTYSIVNFKKAQHESCKWSCIGDKMRTAAQETENTSENCSKYGRLTHIWEI